MQNLFTHPDNAAVAKQLEGHDELIAVRRHGDAA
jgi:hypothetical protein